METVSDLQQALPEAMCNGPHETNGHQTNGHPALAVHVEVCLKVTSTIKTSDLERPVRNFLYSVGSCLVDSVFTTFPDAVLTDHVQSITVADANVEIEEVPLQQATLHISCFQLCGDGPAQESLDDEGELSAATHWVLPAQGLHGVWESLVYSAEIKAQLLQYAATALLYSECEVDPNIVSWNKVVLLHGPPGTGKTSLCKALAQKLCIRLNHKYSYGQLIEINSHSLFSKWFSESGKLVTKMFQKIQEMIDDPTALVCVLMDEVESLTTARKMSMSGSEPSDAIRVVNALLTQIDQIKRYPNVLILTTSNVTGAIDLAFVDRADIKQYIGPPNQDAAFQILHSCVGELMRRGILAAEAVLPYRSLRARRAAGQEVDPASLKLWAAAGKAVGLSGRNMRKLPFLTHALFLQQKFASLDVFLAALEKTIERQFQEEEDLTRS